MSQFVTYNTKALRNREVLLAALTKMGFTVNAADIHDTPVPVRDYYGGIRNLNIIVRKSSTVPGLSYSYSDWGFVQETNGNWTPVVDHLHSINNVPIGQCIEKAYASIAADRAVHTILTKTIPAWKAAGKVPVNAVVKRVPAGKTTRIVLSYQTA